MKIELKHFLPYVLNSVEVTIDCKQFPELNAVGKLAGLQTKDGYECIDVILEDGTIDFFHKEDIKMHLIPLSELNENSDYEELYNDIISEYNYPNFGHLTRSVESKHASQALIELLNKEHFDTQNLIENGLAIDLTKK